MTFSVGITGTGVMGAEQVRIRRGKPQAPALWPYTTPMQARRGPWPMTGDDALMIPMETDTGAIVSTEVQMTARVGAIAKGRPVGTLARDGHVATAIAEQVVTALRTGEPARLSRGPRPDLYP